MKAIIITALILFMALAAGLFVAKALKTPAPLTPAASAAPERPRPIITKRVAAKIERLEHSLYGHGSDTEYYLVASDATTCHVGMGYYALAQVGDSVASAEWY